MNRSEILGTAKSHITKDREATHGKPENSFGAIAGLWSSLLGHAVTSEQVALMLSCLKIARAWGNPRHADNWIDLAGYAACGGEIATSKTLPREGLPFAVVKAERDAERAIDTEPQPLEWPQTPEISPPEGLDASVLGMGSADTEIAPVDRVCGGCRFGLPFPDPKLVNCWQHGSWRAVGANCRDWEPRPTGLAGVAARDQTAYSAQDSGVEE